MSDLRVGLLVCDHVPRDLRAVAGDYPDMFSRLFDSGGVELVPYDVVGGELPRDPGECDGWLTTGSRFSVYDPEPWIAPVAGFLRRVHRARIPLVGVCFGHQLIAHALGGTVARASGGWGVGAHLARVVEATPWMRPPKEGYRIPYSHQDQVVELPPGGRILAATDHSPVAMLAVGDHLLGVQGHPEFPPAFLLALLERRRGDRIPVPVADAALATLADPLDRRMVGDWIAAFWGRR